MATRKQFIKLMTIDNVIPRGTNTVGGKVIGDYLAEGVGRVVVVEMPKVEKKAPGKKAVRKTPAQKITESIERRLENSTKGQEVTHA